MRYVALLRAINVGGHTVKMDRLRALFDEMDLANVETFIASGNVLFDAPARSIDALERRIEKHLEHALGYEVPTFVRSLVALSAVLESHPFQSATEDGHSLYIGFAGGTITPEVRKKLKVLETSVDFLHTSEREVYWLCHGKMLDSLISMKGLEKALAMPITFRNVTTVRKLAAKATAST